MQEPIDSVTPLDWEVWGDWRLDHYDYAGEARARRIALTLASGRTGLYLEFQHVEEDRPKVSAVHYTSRAACMADPDRGVYRWLTQSEWDMGAAGREFQSNYSPLNPAMRQDAFCYRLDVARLFFDRLDELGPLIWLSEDSPTVNVPASVAVCPECGRGLRVRIFSCYESSREPHKMEVECSVYLHRHTEPLIVNRSVRDTVEHWARDTVRVRTTREKTEVT